MDDLIINSFEILIKKEINVRYLVFCFNRRRGFYHFNLTKSDDQKLTKDEWELLKKTISLIKL